MKRHLVRQLIDEAGAAGELPHFAPIASTAGLVDLVCDLIGELKRLEIWPEDFQRAVPRAGVTAKDRELLDLYQAYQQRLQEHHLYDAEGRFWSARDWLKKSWAADGAAWPAARLGRRCGWSWPTASPISPARSTRFSTFSPGGRKRSSSRSPWRRDVASRGANCSTSRCGRWPSFAGGIRRYDGRGACPARRPVWPAMAHLERSLFGNPRHAPAGGGRGRAWKSSPRPARLDEIELIAARIKRLLVEGDAGGGRAVRPGEIAVVFRHPQDAGGLAAEVFAAFGIPAAMELGQPLGRCAGGRRPG